jgi:hypothetical protein
MIHMCMSNENGVDCRQVTNAYASPALATQQNKPGCKDGIDQECLSADLN